MQNTLNTQAELVILQISDLHILAEGKQKMAGIDTAKSFKQLLKSAINKHTKIDLLLVTGDLAQDPCQSSYQLIVDELAQYPIRTICLPGNHDDFDLMQQIINTQHVNCDKHIQLNNWQIIALNSQKPNSHSGYLSENELSFLTDCLKKSADTNTLIAVHHHPIPTHSRWLDTMVIENEKALFSILKKHAHVKAMVCGHIHQPLEEERNNILILGTPSTCFQFKPKCSDYTLDNEPSGYRIINLYSDGHIQSQLYRVVIV